MFARIEWRSLFLSWDGRIGRRDFWIASTIMFILCFVVSSAVILLIAGNTHGASFFAPILFIIIFPIANGPAIVKRLHDRAKSEQWYGLMLVAPICWVLFFLVPFPMKSFFSFAATISSVVYYWFFVELGFLRGTCGPNNYGAEPLDRSRKDSSC